MTKDYRPAHVIAEEEGIISKTQLKNEAKALHDFGKQLIELPAAKVAQLPLMDSTKAAIAQYHIQSGNIARKRHLAYIGKCLRHDDAEAARIFIVEDSFSQVRAQLVKKKPEVPATLIDQLIVEGDAKIQQLCESCETLDRQTLRQLVRNVNKAKGEAKIQLAKEKLNSFLLLNYID